LTQGKTFYINHDTQQEEATMRNLDQENYDEMIAEIKLAREHVFEWLEQQDKLGTERDNVHAAYDQLDRAVKAMGIAKEANLVKNEQDMRELINRVETGTSTRMDGCVLRRVLQLS